MEAINDSRSLVVANYFRYCIIDADQKGKNILEIGRGETPAINFCKNLGVKSCCVLIEELDSGQVPFINYDEVWLFDVLSFCQYPERILNKAKSHAPVIRFFEPVGDHGRQSSLSQLFFDNHFKVYARFPKNSKIVGFHDSECFYGVYEKDFIASPSNIKSDYNTSFNSTAAPALCISNPDDAVSVGRRELVRLQFSKHNVPFSFLPATTPKNEVVPEITKKRPTEWACASSHSRALEYVVYTNSFYFIFEDDVILCDDFRSRIEYIDKLCEDGFSFDFLAIGGHFDAQDYMPRETKYRHIHHLEKMNGTYAYIISAAAADFFVRNWTHEYGADEFFSRFLFPAFAGRCFAFLPFLCATRPGVSTITGNYWEHESVWWHYEQKAINLNHEA